MRMKNRFAIGAAALLSAQGALAIDLTFTAGVELEWTDNAHHSSDDHRNDLLETARVGVLAQESESWYQLDLGYEVSHERYERDTFDAETYYNGTGNLLLIPLPERFDWAFSVQSSTTQTRSVLPNTPDNRDQRTIYSTTPRLSLLSLARDTVSVSATASKIDFRDAESSESERLSADLNWSHLLSSLTSTNVVVGQEEVDFDIEQDYKREYYMVGFTRQINNGSFSLSTGQTRVKPDQGEDFDGVNFRGSINWSNGIHALLLEAHRDLTDTGAGLMGVGGTQDYLSPTEVNTGDVAVVTRTMVSLSDTYTLSSLTTLYGSIYADQEEAERSEEAESDSRRVGASLAFRRALTPQLNMSAEARYERSTDGADDIEDDTTILLLSLDRRFGERLVLRSWLEREESDNEIDGLDYVVHTIGASLTATF